MKQKKKSPVAVALEHSSDVWKLIFDDGTRDDIEIVDGTKIYSWLLIIHYRTTKGIKGSQIFWSFHHEKNSVIRQLRAQLLWDRGKTQRKSIFSTLFSGSGRPDQQKRLL